MNEPEAYGHSPLSGPQTAFKHLAPGVRYEVIKGFTDYDGKLHPVGESWVFVGHSFLPYDDGLSLFVSLDGQSEWHIRLQWRDEEQGPVIDSLNEYVRTAS